MSRPAPARSKGRGGRAPRPGSVEGLDARLAAVEILHRVVQEQQALDQLLDPDHGLPPFLRLGAQDRGLVRAIVGAALRRLGTLRAVLSRRLARGLPNKAGRLEAALLVGAAQLLFLDVPAHAAVDLAVRTVRSDQHAQHFAALANAVLRGIAAEGLPPDLDSEPGRDTPDWLYARWRTAYGEADAAAIAAMHRTEPALDLTVPSDPQGWAERLGGLVLPTGTVRVVAKGPVTALPGYDEGAWWVQDAAAAVPAQLFGAVAALRIADLCAAPGGKTAQLAAAGARVTAIDRSGPRLARLSANLARLGLAAEVVEADARTFAAEPFDAVLLDAPCSATGTIRRHPDVAWTKRPADITSLTALQADLVDAAVRLLRPGGRLVYSVCSLEPEEGEAIVEAALARHPALRLDRIDPAELAGLAELVTDRGWLRILPFQLPNPEPRLAGLDGFFAARLVRS